jgi:AcrR family transcriptional regulator
MVARGSASTSVARRVEHATDTRRAILAAARQAFALKGYAATSLEDIVTPARLTKGALYHHFESKAAVLEALYVEMEEQLAARVAAAVAAAEDDAWGRLVAALEAFFAGSAEPDYARIVLRDAPPVLGGRHGREIDQAIGLALVCELVEGLQRAALMPPLSVPAVARVLLAATGELAVAMAFSDDPESARLEGIEVVLAILAGLRATAAAPPSRRLGGARHPRKSR